MLLYVTVRQAGGAGGGTSGGGVMDHNVLLNTIQAATPSLERRARLDVVTPHYDPCAAPSGGVCENGGECTSLLDVVSDDIVSADSPQVSGSRVKQSGVGYRQMFSALNSVSGL